MRRRAAIIAVALPCMMGAESAEARLAVLVDKSSQRMVVIQDGHTRYIWPVSTGRDNQATPNGVYVPQRLERSWFSRAYYRSPMPYSIFFHNGYAIHGSYAISQLGGPASHGCVRLHPDHAAILFALVQQEGSENTTIEVTDELQPNLSPVPTRDLDTARNAYPPVSYRDIDYVAELTNGQRGSNRPLAAAAPVPPRPPPAPRRDLSDRIERTNPPRGPCPARGTLPTTSRPPNEPADCHTKPNAVTGQLPEQTQQSYGYKILPPSCWSGASWRWRWRSDHETPCK
jgi:hypothetical protein